MVKGKWEFFIHADRTKLSTAVHHQHVGRWELFRRLKAEAEANPHEIVPHAIPKKWELFKKLSS